MNMLTEESVEDRPDKLYSKRSIGIATFLGGPLAACIMIRRNFLNLGDEKSGLITIFLGALITMAIIISVIVIPDSVFEKFPAAIVPAIYTGIIMLVLEKTQGTSLKLQQDVTAGFYSGWRAAGIGLISAAILLGSLFAVILSEPEDPTIVAYDQMASEFSINEDRAMKLYTLLEEGKYNDVPDFVATEGIPAWQENLVLLKNFGYIQNVPKELASNVKLLNKYCILRIQTFDLMRKAVLEDSNTYDPQLEKIQAEIDNVLEEMN